MFFIEELSIIKFYKEQGKNLQEIINELKITTKLKEENEEMKELEESTLRKLLAISEEEFKELNFDLTITTEDFEEK
jgi:hypothetical protein